MSTPLATASINGMVVRSPAARIMVETVWIPLTIANEALNGILN